MSPAAGDGIVFTQIWRQSPIHAIRLTPGGAAPEPVWVSAKPGPQEPSLLYYRGILYALLDTGILTALEGATGRELYRERVAAEANSSPVAADGRIYVSDIRGRTTVLQAGPEPRVLAANELGERITASPALVSGKLLLRTDSRLWCVQA
ncbi:MAG: PQQ-like beta-propeller repeat protein [Armatimonadetes bacterium]|nr:PQQ-like beta-propeller repeat protein [Armatimonadota bacterium]